jgi:hypothetical protein
VSAPPDAYEGVVLRHDGGKLTVLARPSEAPPDQLAALRAHKAELLPILAAFGEAQVLIRPATPIPDEPKLGDRVWSRPLRPRRRKAA